MAAAQSEFHRGRQGIAEQERTFRGFLLVTIWASALVAMAVLQATLVFVVGTHWLPTLMGVLVLGVLVGLAFKLKASWYGAVAAFAVVVTLAGVVGEIVARLPR